MSNLDLQEQEELATLKGWWQEHGNRVITAVTVALFAFAAWNAWQWYQRSQATQASGLYEALQKAATDKDTKKVRDAAGSLIAEFPRTAYAALGALVSAKVQFDAGELATAKTQLEWVVQNAKDPELAAIGRIRLANVLVDEKAYDAALQTLDAKLEGELDGMAAGLRADILALQGKKAEARTAYKAAIDKIDPSKAANQRERIQMKLDALGESDT
jgi:predicted negative regulator of RcsB-dependent stress response